MADKNPSASSEADSFDNVWSYRGYKIKPGEFNTAMVHFYRGELARSNVWRQRLDSTTNWAVVTTAAVLTFAFGTTSGEAHIVILLSFLLVLLFLMIETRRYRYYELWSLRIRLMETDFFAAMLNPPFKPHQEWAAALVDSLLTPEFPISFLEAAGRRLRRNYLWLFLILGIAWTLKLMLYSGPTYSTQAFFNQAAVGPISGLIITMFVTSFIGAAFVIAILSARLRDSPGEVLPRSEVFNLSGGFLQDLVDAAGQVLPEELPFLHRRDQLAIIITDQTEVVSQQLMSLFKRGVTALQGTGMYTKAPRGVLLCVVAAAEIDNLKSAVYNVDEDAFVVVNSTQEAWGAGFDRPQPKWRRSKRDDKT